MKVCLLIVLTLNVVRSEDPEPEKATACPKYDCTKQKDQTACVLSTYDTTTHSSAVHIGSACEKNKYCKVAEGGAAWYIFQTATKAESGACTDVPTVKITGRYPGEACEDSENCVKTTDKTGTCDAAKKTCIGVAAGAECTRREECVAGYTCLPNAELKFTCIAQLGSGVACTDTFDCKNNLTCWEGKCNADAWFSQENKTDLKTKTTLPNNAFLCKSGRAENGVCYSLNADGTKDAKTGLIKCTPDTAAPCKYKHDGVESKPQDQPCACGYNATGQGYCPAADDTNSANLTAFHKAYVSSWNNACHSVSRFSCYKSDPAKALDAQNHSLNSHLYQDAVSCVSVISADYFKATLVSLIAIMALLF